MAPFLDPTRAAFCLQELSTRGMTHRTRDFRWLSYRLSLLRISFRFAKWELRGTSGLKLEIPTTRSSEQRCETDAVMRSVEQSAKKRRSSSRRSCPFFTPRALHSGEDAPPN